MREGSYECRLSHEPNIVSAFVADLRNDAKWRQEIVDVELRSGTPGEAGAEYIEHVEWEGLRAHTSLKVTEVEPGMRVNLVGQDPGMRASFNYRFELAEDGTLLKLSVSLETMGALRLMEPFMWGIITRWLERDLCNMGTVIDGYSPG